MEATIMNQGYVRVKSGFKAVDPRAPKLRTVSLLYAGRHAGCLPPAKNNNLVRSSKTLHQSNFFCQRSLRCKKNTAQVRNGNTRWQLNLVLATSIS